MGEGLVPRGTIGRYSCLNVARFYLNLSLGLDLFRLCASGYNGSFASVFATRILVVILRLSRLSYVIVRGVNRYSFRTFFVDATIDYVGIIYGDRRVFIMTFIVLRYGFGHGHIVYIS